MFRLLVVAVVAIYGILQVYGDPARRPEPVARSAAPGIELIPAAFQPSLDEPETSNYVSPISEAEAVKIALKAGENHRQSRTIATLRGATNAKTTEVSVAQPSAAETTAAPVFWEVTGTRVNLRSGPGTSNAVVGQVTQGMQAEMLAEADGWYQIRSADGSASGWISGKFLQPG